MTNALLDLLGHTKTIREGDQAHARYDALVEDYDGTGRDLLIELKSSVDPGSVRLAVGQLLDYRRHVPRRAATDLAVLLPEEPSAQMAAYLADVGVKALWFADADLSGIVGLSVG